ncbi:MAG: transferrin-binding protein-like solute binding protein [Moraxellaceae bacterium]|nr:transferrin-binding protein-like solute binding protein [Moraxellaceae bacterium]
MKMKYLSLALSAVLMSTLTACGGSDSDDNYNAEVEAQQQAAAKKKAEEAKKAAEAKKKAEEAAAKAAAEKVKAEAAAAKAAAEKAKAEAAAAKAAAAKAQAEAAKEAEKAKKAEEAKKAAEEARLAAEKAKKALEDAEKARLEKIKADEEAEAQRKKEEADKLAKEKAEKERLAKLQAEGNTDPENNLVGISMGGKLELKQSTGTQNYNRAINSQFDLENNPQGKSTKEKGDGAVVTFDELQNKQMANIVLARNKATRAEDRVTFLLGSTKNDRANPSSLQQINIGNIDTSLQTIADNAKNNGLVYVKGNTVRGAEETQNFKSDKGDTRIFGANWTTDANTAFKANSSVFPTEHITGALAPSAGYNYSDFYNDADMKKLINRIDLKNVQYGRVTTQLDTLDKYKKGDTAKGVKEQLGKGGKKRYYYQIDPSKTTDKSKNDVLEFLNVTNNSDKKFDVDTYFYRGNDRTTELPKAGTADYYGQALMYGLNNSYHDLTPPKQVENKEEPAFSNSILIEDPKPEEPKEKYVDGIGNFVKAKVDFAKKTVDGSVYNVWRKEKGNKLVPNDLVSFKGVIKGQNSVSGTAGRTYVNKGKHDADFTASFYGKEGAEMGGSFSSIQKKDGEAQFGNVGWGGVFGAAKVPEPEQPKKPENGPEAEF